MGCGGEILNIISAYAPQVGCTEVERGNFWRDMDGVMQKLEEHERIIVGADFNGHVGSENEAIGQVHGGYGFGERNQGESVVDFAVSFDMAILLNEENDRLLREHGQVNIGMVIWFSRHEVINGLRKMKNGKATGPDMIPVEAWKAFGDEGMDILYDLMIKIFQQKKIPNEWRGSILLPIFKGKGDVQECGNYRGIKMSHALKIVKRMIDAGLREEVEIGKEQMGFMKGRGTTDGVICLWQLMEKFRKKQRDLHVVFIDLEKAYDESQDKRYGGV
ncbi:uncharacterized protein [Palaemon carinicauda]|uniref:uncharacterized protein n=1 Tax=Palaemon carinicauda TaxID=392227 RepID=UPI0035B627D3